MKEVRENLRVQSLIKKGWSAAKVINDSNLKNKFQHIPKDNLRTVLQQEHFKFRALQRFGWVVSLDFIDLLNELIVKGKLPIIRRKSDNTGILYLFEYNYSNIGLLYDLRHHNIVTCYPVMPGILPTPPPVEAILVDGIPTEPLIPVDPPARTTAELFDGITITAKILELLLAKDSAVARLLLQFQSPFLLNTSNGDKVVTARIIIVAGIHKQMAAFLAGPTGPNLHSAVALVVLLDHTYGDKWQKVDYIHFTIK